MIKSLFIALQAQGGFDIKSVGMLVAMAAVFYFFMIRPQMKKQKELANFRAELKKGDKIITTGGVYGKIAEMAETTITLEVQDGSKMKVDKSAIVKDMTDAAK
ncbi:MAG: preprotein translocase subunit YajC [Marinifilaceae bacterium]